MVARWADYRLVHRAAAVFRRAFFCPSRARARRRPFSSFFFLVFSRDCCDRLVKRAHGRRRHQCLLLYCFFLARVGIPFNVYLVPAHICCACACVRTSAGTSPFSMNRPGCPRSFLLFLLNYQLQAWVIREFMVRCVGAGIVVGRAGWRYLGPSVCERACTLRARALCVLRAGSFVFCSVDSGVLRS